MSIIRWLRGNSNAEQAAINLVVPAMVAAVESAEEPVTEEIAVPEPAYPGFPPGHFYSPIVDVEQVKANAVNIWRHDAPVLGIDFNDSSHVQLLEQVFPQFIADYDYPDELEETPTLTQFFSLNSQFSWLDARLLFVMLRHLRPRRVIEVGSGFSSLLTADVNQRFLQGTTHFTCIEPYPRAFLSQQLGGLTELLVQKVEEVPLEHFASLQKGDVLFIDSSHVSKTGSDVNYLFFEVLPRLQSGVLIHIHDIFLPHEYLQHWVIDDYRSWNEQYLLRALLMYSTVFRVVFGSAYAFYQHRPLVEKALGLESGKGFGGGSMWIERI
jgi:predicted O-methyltransferase YrrM